MAAINHTNVTLIEQWERVEKILAVHKAHSNTYRSSSGYIVTPLRFSNINSGTLMKTEQTNISVLKLTDTYHCLMPAI